MLNKVLVELISILQNKEVREKSIILNKQVNSLKVIYVREYDEELFTILFDFVNKIEVGELCIEFSKDYRRIKDKKSFCTKLEHKITKSIISNDVSYFFSFYQ